MVIGFNRMPCTPSSYSMNSQEATDKTTRVDQQQQVDLRQDKTGIVSAHLLLLQQVAPDLNSIISLHPVNKLTTELRERGCPTKGFHLNSFQGGKSTKNITHDEFNRYATSFASTAEKEVNELIIFMRGLERPESFEKMSLKHNGLFAARKGLDVAAGAGITIGATAIGALIGTAIMPIVGTAVGGLLGFGTGIAIGAGIKKALSRGLETVFSKISEKTGTVKNIYPRTEKIRNKIDIATSEAIHNYLHNKMQALRDLKNFKDPEWHINKLKEYGPQITELALNKVAKSVSKGATAGSGYLPSIPIVDIIRMIDDTNRAKHTSLAKLKKIDELLSDIRSTAETNVATLSYADDVDEMFSSSAVDDDEVPLIESDVTMDAQNSLLSQIEYAKALLSQLWMRDDISRFGESNEWFNKENDDDFLGVNIRSSSAGRSNETSVNDTNQSSESNREQSTLLKGTREYQRRQILNRAVFLEKK